MAERVRKRERWTTIQHEICISKWKTSFVTIFWGKILHHPSYKILHHTSYKVEIFVRFSLGTSFVTVKEAGRDQQPLLDFSWILLKYFLRGKSFSPESSSNIFYEENLFLPNPPQIFFTRKTLTTFFSSICSNIFHEKEPLHLLKDCWGKTKQVLWILVQIWPIVCGSTCISSKFDYHVMPPELVPNLVNM